MWSGFILGLLLIQGLYAGAQASAKGHLSIDPEYPYAFRFESGARFFPMGDTAYFLIALPLETIKAYIDERRAHRFNFMRMMAICDGHWPFGGSPASPDYTTINEAAMQKLDWVFDYAAEKGMYIELILWGYGVDGGEGLWGNELRENLWIDTVVGRYGNRANLFMFTVANEFERYPDGRYRYQPGDVDWAKRVLQRIRGLDSLHPIGVHPSVWISGYRVPPCYGRFCQRLPQVVWPLWENSTADVFITQNNQGVHPARFESRKVVYDSIIWEGTFYPVSWTPTGWDIEGPGLEDSIAEDRQHGRPVLNTEFGYQYEPDSQDHFGAASRQQHQPASTRKKAWKIATGGGYFAAGFAPTAVRHFSGSDVKNWRPESLQILYDFFTIRTRYWKMAPHMEGVAAHNVLLASPGEEYVAYFPRGGSNSVYIAAGSYTVEWLNPEKGVYYRQAQLKTPGGHHRFSSPDKSETDWVLHLRSKAAAEAAQKAHSN